MGRYEYGEGPWSSEPDRLEFEASGLPCLLRRNDLGAWCGYVAVPRGHPCHGKSLHDLCHLEAHGGITYGHACAGDICHVPKEGAPDDVWWIGFDCAHAFDLIPWMHAQLKEMKGELFATQEPVTWRDQYRDLEYVKNECVELAAQLVALA